MWTGSKNNMGYGRISVKGKVKLTHRISWEMTKQPIPKGVSILHKCDNPLCVNPEHLMEGTQKDNMRDMSEKNRWGNQYHKNI